MNRVINILYTLLWIVGISLFVYFIFSDKRMDYISAIAILLSAFLASLSVLKSINHSNKINNQNLLHNKHTNIIHLDFLLLDLYRQIKLVKNEFEHISERHIQLHAKTNVCKISKNDADEYLLNMLTDRKEQLLKRLSQIEDKEILYALDEGQRIILLKISNYILLLEEYFNHIENSNNVNVFNSFVQDNSELFTKILKLIEILKQDIEKEYSDLTILLLEKYEK